MINHSPIQSRISKKDKSLTVSCDDLLCRDLLDPTDPLVRMADPAAMEPLALLVLVERLDTLDLL